MLGFVTSPPVVSPAMRFRPSSRRSSLYQVRSCAGPSPQLDPGVPEKLSSLRKTTTTTPLWTSALGAVGFLETSYLSYLKITGSEAFCPLSGGGGGCGDVLNSDYSVIFGVPLPWFGMVAYGLVTLISFQQAGRTSFSELKGLDPRIILLGTSTSMATASGYFLYLLSTKFAGSSCVYCVLSAILSFSIFLITLQDFGMKEIQKTIGLQLAIAGIVLGALAFSYTTATSTLGTEIELDPFETEVTNKSTSMAISLAKHLHFVGAKIYGAFWCSHCQEQKQMFGQEAAKLLDYVECFPNGVGKGRKIDNDCLAAGIEGFPTWMINGHVLSGEQSLQDLAEVSGFLPKCTES